MIDPNVAMALARDAADIVDLRRQLAEARRMLAGMEENAAEARQLAHTWMQKHDKLLGFIQKRPALLKELIEEDAARRSGEES